MLLIVKYTSQLFGQFFFLKILLDRHDPAIAAIRITLQPGMLSAALYLDHHSVQPITSYYGMRDL